MLGKNLIKQLSQLKEIKPDAGWKARNRDILVKQIYGSQAEEAAGKKSWIWYWQASSALLSSVSQPAWVAIFIFIFLIGGGTASVKMAERTKPGDSLYIAKLISERTQLALTFGDAGKARLGLQFANNRVAEINQVLAEPATPGKDQNVANLLSDLKSQISNVKTNIAAISPTAVAVVPVVSPTKVSGQDNDSNNHVFISSDLKKDNKGVEISNGADASVSGSAASTSTAAPAANNPTVSASSTPALNITQTADILQQAEQLLNQNKYSDTLTKLNEADQSITATNNGSSTTATGK